MVTDTGRRPRGRPPKDDVREDNIRLTIRLTPELRRRIRALIETDSDMGGFARRAVEEHVDKLERRRQAAAT